ncbi:MAG: HAD family phosphatase [Dehalococcoidia bacterium]
MIRAFIFDLDGTLVETEMLKARAYAALAQRLLGLDAPDGRAIKLYGRLVGSTDEVFARAMVEELGLAPALLCTGGEEPWEALHRLRMELYRREFGTGEALRAAAYEHSLALLREQRAAGRLAAVATSSFTPEAKRVLALLGVAGRLDAVVGREQVSRSKPDPEIYLTTAERLGIRPGEAVVVEDSVVGLAAGVAAGMPCIAVASAFSGDSLREQTVLAQEWVVYDPVRLPAVAARRIAAAAG